MKGEITISPDVFSELLTAKREADMLKAILNAHKYVGIDGRDVALLCKLLGIESEKE